MWTVYDHETPAGEEVARSRLHALFARETDAKAEAASRGGRTSAVGPCNLLAMCLNGFADETVVREVLSHGQAACGAREWGPPSSYAGCWNAVPLTPEETARAAKASVWFIWYEDQFHVGEARDSYPVSICLSREEADREMRNRKPLEPGWDGYFVMGPSPLAREGESCPSVGADVVRDVLRRRAEGRPGPVPV